MDSLVVEAPASEAPEARTDVDAVPLQAPVLVAMDFYPDSEAALLWACDYAKSVGAPVEVLHVIHDPADAPGTYRSDNGDLLEPMADVAQRKMTAFLDRMRADHPRLHGLENAKLTCTQGLPASTILDVAQAQGAQLVVLGSRGRNGLARVLLGSTSQSVVQQAPIPVTIVKTSAQSRRA